MTSLIGLLLGASAHKRRALAQYWMQPDDLQHSNLVANLFRRMSDESILLSFVAGLPPDRRTVLRLVAAQEGGGITFPFLARALPFAEDELRQAVDDLQSLGLVWNSAAGLDVADDLRVMLNGLDQGQCVTSTRRKYAGDCSCTSARRGFEKLGAGRHDPLVGDCSADFLTKVGEPARVVLATNSATYDVASYLLGDDQVGADTIRLAARFATVYGLGGSLAPVVATARHMWLALSREDQELALLEFWLSDRETTPDVPGHRLRQRLLMALRACKGGEWLDALSLFGSCTMNQIRQYPLNGGSGAWLYGVFSRGLVELRLLGLLDLGTDAEGGSQAARLTALGVKLVERAGRGTER